MRSSSSGERLSRVGIALGVLGALAAAAFIVLVFFIKGETTCTGLLRWPTLWVGFGEPIAEPGPYRLQVRADGKDLSCDFQVPLGRFGERGCRGFDVQGTHDGAARGIGLDNVHRHLSVVVERDGTVVRWGAFEPEYRGVEVNGPGCGEQEIGEPVVLSEPGE